MEPIPYVHFSYGIIEKERRKNNTEHCMHKGTSIHTRTLNFFFNGQRQLLITEKKIKSTFLLSRDIFYDVHVTASKFKGLPSLAIYTMQYIIRNVYIYPAGSKKFLQKQSVLMMYTHIHVYIYHTCIYLQHKSILIHTNGS